MASSPLRFPRSGCARVRLSSAPDGRCADGLQLCPSLMTTTMVVVAMEMAADATSRADESSSAPPASVASRVIFVSTGVICWQRALPHGHGKDGRCGMRTRRRGLQVLRQLLGLDPNTEKPQSHHHLHLFDHKEE